MKNIILFVFLMCFQLSFSCSHSGGLKQDSTKNEIEKYDSPTNTTIYISALDKKVNLNELSDWIENDTNKYLGINYYYNAAGINDDTYEEINFTEDKPRFRGGEEKFIELNAVKITGNQFYSVLTINNIYEEMNGKFVKMKAPPNTESEFIYGLLVNRKGVWKFYYRYV